MKQFSLKALVVAAVLGSAGSASAVTLNIDSGWDRFAFGAVGTLAKRVFTFTLSGFANLSIVDGYLAGDQFEVFLNTVSQGLTSVPVQGTTNLGANYDAAFGDPDFSNWTQRLGPGSYTLTMLVTQRSGTNTIDHLGAVRLDTAPIPLPAAGLLLLTALGAAAAARRRSI
ncbi:VPLPA-CTERM sorting domain-containing protein [Frigidibacter sp. SD6-1]|uniref:VPLPA-CTERM sorting domain-containing protein n=1 Tax=Frigidibacter sp. SD6-1 TaxID=3032581 RepID=UPI0024DF5A1D|nr:VPLPA-CTERM sorting domain-containing protein [Frigidibacter sp. SD6-1]